MTALEDKVTVFSAELIYHREYPYGQFGSGVPAVSPPSFLPTPLPSHCTGGDRERKRERKHQHYEALLTNNHSVGGISTALVTDPNHRGKYVES